MINWKDEEPDIRVLNWNEFPWDNLKINKNEFMDLLNKRNYIFFNKNAWNSIWEHGKSSKSEVGGLLIGLVFKYNENYLWYIEETIYNQDISNSISHLIMYPSLWQEANQKILNKEGYPEKFILGWYHTHPNFTPFFSLTDQNTHKNFFNYEYSIGMVLDPFSERFIIYIGKDIKEYKDLIAIYNIL